jgi:glycosyltransferase involved in cell wall biosynthesis
MKAFRHMARRMGGLLWLTDAEKRLSENIWGLLPGQVVAMPVETEPVKPASLGYPYLLYSGRIDEGKGSYELIEYFTQLKHDYPSPLRLVLTGPNKIGVTSSSDIVCLGQVSTHEKLALMGGAHLFVMPSQWESFSIATLEAMAQGTAVLVNGKCDVLLEHVARSGAGRSFIDSQSFAAAVLELLHDDALLGLMGEKAREYVVSRFQRGRIRDELVRQVKSLRSASERRTRTTPPVEK